MNTKEKDIQIIKQLMGGNHLSESEINRAKQLIWLFNNELTERSKSHNKRYDQAMSVTENQSGYDRRTIQEAHIFIEGYHAKEGEMLWGDM